MTSVAAREPEGRGRWTNLWVLGGFCTLAFTFFGLRILIEPGHQYVGLSDDPQIFIWSFGWWLHALEHFQNPFVEHVLWAPSGVNLAWATTAPALAVIFAPLTASIGPVASYDVAAVLMPALSAWTAYLLCRHLVGRFWPAAVGGYLFGFSSYQLGHMLGEPHLTSVFAIPLIALVIVRAFAGELGPGALIVRLGPLVALQIYLSTEIALTATVSLVLALALALLLVPEWRQRLVRLLPPLAGAYLFAALLAAPLLYYALTDVRLSGFTPPQDYTGDILNFVMPTHLEAVGAGWAHAIARHFRGNIIEQSVYIGLPVLAIVLLFARQSWRTPRGRFLVVSVVLASYLSLGPSLIMDGHKLVPLPTPLGHERLTVPGAGSHLIPLVDNILPVRFALFASLAGAVIVAMWMSTGHSRLVGVGLPALAVILLIPNPGAGSWATTYTVPAFFTNGAFRRCLAPNEIVLPEPVGAGGQATLWQAVDGFRFRMAGGRLATSPPSKFLHPPPIAVVSIGLPMAPNQESLLGNYFRVEGVSTVIVARPDLSTWAPILNRIARPQAVGGIVLYRVGAGAGSCD